VRASRPSSRSLALRLLIGCALAPMLLAPALSRADSGGQDSSSPDGTPQRIVFQDNFDGAINSSPDLTKWTYDLFNRGGWGNHEMESYTKDPETASLDGSGHLRITAHRNFDPLTHQWNYTSARIKTISYPFMYGRAEARIKVPSGQGLWPAFWMLGLSSPGAMTWPNCGEIDVMENVGRLPKTVFGAVHGPAKALMANSDAYHRTATATLSRPLSADYHLFAVDAAPGVLKFSVDGRVYKTLRRSDMEQGESWVYDRPFQILLNLAVGGDFPGAPSSHTRFPATMLIDYVKITTSTN
jgi:beta-glucanase (GH16 family)